VKRFCDFRQMKVHRLGIAGRQDQGCALALLRADGTEDAADAGHLRAAGQSAIADGIDEIIGTMRRHVDRELARARLRGGGRSQPDASTARPAAECTATFASAAAGRAGPGICGWLAGRL
jgi:hypothetical protein